MIPKMTYYAVVSGMGRDRRYVPVSLPLVAAIADEAHYRPPPSFQEQHPHHGGGRGWAPEFRRRLEEQQLARRQRRAQRRPVQREVCK